MRFGCGTTNWRSSRLDPTLLLLVALLSALLRVDAAACALHPGVHCIALRVQPQLQYARRSFLLDGSHGRDGREGTPLTPQLQHARRSFMLGGSDGCDRRVGSSSKPQRQQARRSFMLDGSDGCEGTSSTAEVAEVLAAAYGEITPVGLRQLARHVQLGSVDTFVDLGSGNGEAVLLAASEFDVASAHGIELVRSRWHTAEQARLGSGLMSRVSFTCGDASEATVARPVLQNATVVWISNLLFDAGFMMRLAARLQEAPLLRAAVVMKPFADGLEGFRVEEQPILCDMSWSGRRADTTEQAVCRGYPCYVYRRRPPSRDLYEAVHEAVVRWNSKEKGVGWRLRT